jgi:hypothetical protein
VISPNHFFAGFLDFLVSAIPKRESDVPAMRRGAPWTFWGIASGKHSSKEQSIGSVMCY